MLQSGLCPRPSSLGYRLILMMRLAILAAIDRHYYRAIIDID